ncbi:pyruvate kinase [Methanolobus sp. WCC1]|jgi:pyruvate kinase|uniref:Pyruvate kinase n=1 Tax=Methanolobus tindarius DSM 2278 TaxID=1090322 RepID=W9DSY8_METTI|nr:MULTISPECIES: pyruvate kinase [Methanolobus]ETA68735.1 pyruvate kinase [Methanolobus tindarius DSM 2278]MDK2831771.1 pyruvate kinase [Methanolobus sp.]
MDLPDHKTKIVCTIGPATSSPEMIRELIIAGMNVARLNFSHGDMDDHRKLIKRIRDAADELNQVVAIMADLPGPKIRVGVIENEPMILRKNDRITLTTKDILGKDSVIPVQYKQIADSVLPGSPIYLSDGFIQLNCDAIENEDIHCKVVVGGPLFSKKGINLPGSKIYVSPITGKDLEIIDFALKEGISIFCLSFIESRDDVVQARNYIESKGKTAFLVSKIEREQAVKNIDSILQETDAIMVARGDLGVEVPIEEVPIIQKKIIHKANLLSKPVITATQMLESMISNIRPTRAEATDVANAIIDGTDAVMLSGETAVGKYPVETVKMMATIAKSTEKWRDHTTLGLELMTKAIHKMNPTIEDVISIQVNEALRSLPVRYVITPTVSGKTSRLISRFRPNVWILAFSRNSLTCEQLTLQYAVYPVFVILKVHEWEATIMDSLKRLGNIEPGDLVLLTQGQVPGGGRSGGTNFLKFIVAE